MKMISSGTYANGSFGIYSRNPRADGATVITVWFCGGKKAEADGKVHDNSISSVCVHKTRDDARKCLRKA